MKGPWICIAALLLTAGSTLAQEAGNDQQSMKMIALEALMTAPDEKALPIVIKLLDGNDSADIKQHALFILSQIDDPAAGKKLLEIAGDSGNPLRVDAIRMIGIGGDDAAVGQLAGLYASGDEQTREAVLEAFLIAGDVDAVYQVAVGAKDNDEFESAVNMLAAMGARDQLRQLRERSGSSETLINAYAVAGDSESLLALARDSSDLQAQARAIEALGIVGGDTVNAALVDIYRGSQSEYVREAALHGLLVAGYDEGVVQLYRETSDMAEKRDLLQALSVMDSELLLELVDEALTGTP